MMRWAGTLVLVLLWACSSGRSKADCEKIAADIRRAADARGLPSQGVCNNQGAPEFREACEALRKCNEEAD